MKQTIILVFAIAAIALAGCDGQGGRRTAHAQRHHQHHPKTNEKVKVKVCRVPRHTATPNSGDDWIYYYILFNSNNSCEYATSTSRVPATRYSSLNWQTSPTTPPAVKAAEADKTVQEEEEEVPEEELGQQAEQEMESSEPAEANDSESPGDGDSSDSSDSSDSGGGDSGGGDSGGGDGGGDGGGGGD